MLASIILIGVLVAVGLPLWLIDRRRHRDDQGDDDAVAQPVDACSDVCCTTHEVCPSQQMIADLDKAATYYDDENLDRYAGRRADDYTDTEMEEFRDVLYTLLPDDRLGWLRSLRKRDITLPAPIRDEFISLAGDQHTAR